MSGGSPQDKPNNVLVLHNNLVGSGKTSTYLAKRSTMDLVANSTTQASGLSIFQSNAFALSPTNPSPGIGNTKQTPGFSQITFKAQNEKLKPY